MTRGVPNKSNKKGAAKTTNAPVDKSRLVSGTGGHVASKSLHYATSLNRAKNFKCPY